MCISRSISKFVFCFLLLSVTALTGCSFFETRPNEGETALFSDSIYMADCKVAITTDEVKNSGSCRIYLDDDRLQFQVFGPFQSLVYEVDMNLERILSINHRDELIEIFPNTESVRAKLLGMVLGISDLRRLLLGKLEKLPYNFESMGQGQYKLVSESEGVFSEVWIRKWSTFEKRKMPTLISFVTAGRSLKLAVTEYVPERKKPQEFSYPENYRRLLHF